MKINVERIFFELKELRDEQDIKEIRTIRNTRAREQAKKQLYNNAVWRELKEIAAALGDYENKIKRERAEQKIIGGICNVAVLSINCWEGEPLREIRLLTEEAFNDLPDYCDVLEFEIKRFEKVLLTSTHNFEFLGFTWSRELKQVLEVCAYLCDFYKFDFRLSMLAKIKELRTGKLANYERIIEEE